MLITPTFPTPLRDSYGSFIYQAKEKIISMRTSQLEEDAGTTELPFHSNNNRLVSIDIDELHAQS